MQARDLRQGLKEQQRSRSLLGPAAFMALELILYQRKLDSGLRPCQCLTCKINLCSFVVLDSPSFCSSWCFKNQSQWARLTMTLWERLLIWQAWGPQACTRCTSAMQAQKDGPQGDFLASQYGENSVIQVSEKPCLKNKVKRNRGRYPKLISGFHRDTGKHAHAQMHYPPT